MGLCVCSGEPIGAFGKWALNASLHGTHHFDSASQVARRHYRQGISDRQCIRAILYEHTKQKFASCDAVMRASNVPALDCSSSSLAYDVLLHIRLLAGKCGGILHDLVLWNSCCIVAGQLILCPPLNYYATKFGLTG